MTRADRLATWAWQHSDAGQAVPALLEAVRLSGGSPNHLKALGVKQAQAGMLLDAVDTLESLVKKVPRDIEAWCILGELSLDRGDFAGAARALGICLQLDPSKTHPSGLRARALIHRGERLLRKRR